MESLYREPTATVHTEQIKGFTDDIDTLIIGSSVMERFYWYAKKTFPKNVLLLAKGGDKMEHCLWRIEHTKPSDKVKLIIMQIGTNNLKPYKSFSKYIADGVFQIVKLLKHQYPNAAIKFINLYHRKDIQPEEIIETNKQISIRLKDMFIDNFWDGLLSRNQYDGSKYLDHVHLNKMSYDWFHAKLLTLM